jgi:hypothetical protein
MGLVQIRRFSGKSTDGERALMLQGSQRGAAEAPLRHSGNGRHARHVSWLREAVGAVPQGAGTFAQAVATPRRGPERRPAGHPGVLEQPSDRPDPMGAQRTANFQYGDDDVIKCISLSVARPG